MRIALAVARFPVLSETFVHDIALALLERGHAVRVLALRGPAAADVRSRDERLARSGLAESATYGGRAPKTALARWLRAPTLRVAPGTLLRAMNPVAYGLDAFSLKLLHRAAPFAGAYDVIHAQYGDIGREVERMRSIGALRGPLVTSLRGHDITGHVGKHGAGDYRRLAANGEYFLPDCEDFRARALEAGFPAARTETWSAGLDLRRFPLRATPPPRPPVRLLAVGRLVEKKGFDDALRALARLEPDVVLEVIGDGRLRGPLETLAAELGIAARVRFLGAQPSEEVRARLEASHVFLAPSVTVEHGLADSSIVTAKEAMAIGLPVVATRHGGIPELVADGVTGLLVPERDPAALAGAVRTLASDAARGEAMGRAGADLVRERFDLARQIDRLEEIYRAVSTSSACTARSS